MKKLGLTALGLLVAWSAYINFMIFGLSSIGGNPYDILSLAASLAGVIGFVAIFFQNKTIRVAGYIGIGVCILKMLSFYLLSSYS